MTEHDDDRRPDEAKADEVERELDEMDERQERLGEEIEGTDEAWERKKKDEHVPGATSDEDDDEDEEDEGEVDADELDFGRALAEDGDDD